MVIAQTLQQGSGTAHPRMAIASLYRWLRGNMGLEAGRKAMASDELNATRSTQGTTPGGSNRGGRGGEEASHAISPTRRVLCCHTEVMGYLNLNGVAS